MRRRRGVGSSVRKQKNKDMIIERVRKCVKCVYVNGKKKTRMGDWSYVCWLTQKRGRYIEWKGQ